MTRFVLICKAVLFFLDTGVPATRTVVKRFILKLNTHSLWPEWFPVAYEVLWLAATRLSGRAGSLAGETSVSRVRSFFR
jgi:hypothetical protein